MSQIDLRKYGFNIHKYDTGEIVINQKTPEYSVEAPNFNGHRGELHEVVFNYARDDLGIPSEYQNSNLYFDNSIIGRDNMVKIEIANLNCNSSSKQQD